MQVGKLMDRAVTEGEFSQERMLKMTRKKLATSSRYHSMKKYTQQKEILFRNNPNRQFRVV